MKVEYEQTTITDNENTWPKENSSFIAISPDQLYGLCLRSGTTVFLTDDIKWTMDELIGHQWLKPLWIKED